ncbi:MAG: MFS transporter [Dehalococcoidia bacterium]|nr:MFS transporter [Dehalococcoidia bacterium]
MAAAEDSSRRFVLVAITLASFLIPLMSSSINVALPTIGIELRMDAVLLGWVATSYLIAAAVFLVPMGKAADIYGRKRIFIYGTVVYTAASLACGLADSGMMLIGFRVMQGIGGAMIFGTGVAILTSVFPPGERGRVLGINVAAVYVGLALGPFLGGILTQYLGWRSVLLANVPAGLVVLGITTTRLRGEWAVARGEKFDLVGSLIYGGMLVSIMYGFTQLPDALGIWMVLAGIAALAAFIFWELRARVPVLDIGLFRSNAVFAFSNLAALINYGATFAVGFLLSLYLQYVKGFDPQFAGIVLVSQPVVQAVFSPFAGGLSDRIEPRTLASTGMGLSVVGLVIFVFLTEDSSLAYVIGGLLVLGFGFALFSAPNTNAIMGSVENRFYGVASATLATMRQVGMTFSMGISMMLFALFVGRVEITPEVHGAFLRSVRTAFIIFACLSFAGVFASLARGKVRPGAGKEGV